MAEDGRELYMISTEFDETKASDWVKENVISQLPPHPSSDWFSRKEIKEELLKFVRGDEKPEFWAYYADYDWVVFCWLFGSMINLPKGWPMYCRDIKQLCDSKGNPKLPEQGKGEHDALEDARWNMKAYKFLIEEIA